MTNIIRRKRTGEAWETVVEDGGSGVQAREQIQGVSVSIAEGGTASLTWDTKASGDDLLDLGTPAAPVVVEAGVYIVTVTLGPVGAMTAGGWYDVILSLDASGENAIAETHSPAASASDMSPIVALTVAYYIPAGGAIDVEVTNHDGVQAIDYLIALGIVQRVS